ncbi:MAG: hypothetical protein OXI55_02490, partial [Gammaproteobacteria bacterium]|nr:hypothetical protein [Gammaproteobacteria bacterium]
MTRARRRFGIAAAVAASGLLVGCERSTPPTQEPPPAPATHRLSVVQGAGDGVYVEGQIVAVIADAPPEHYTFSHWSSNAGGAFGDDRAARTSYQMPGNDVTVTANFLPGTVTGGEASAARRWNEVLLHAIRGDYARPTVHARNLFHVAAAVYDAWAAYDDDATPWLLGTDPCPLDDEAFGVAAASAPRAARPDALSFAASRIIEPRFRDSPPAARLARH